MGIHEEPISDQTGVDNRAIVSLLQNYLRVQCNRQARLNGEFFLSNL